ncbi:hypothetical protein VP01_672g1 [Puccinia sorghi]|uniref:Uncharacterized protein n=1 Tax=Puccinia sorghi TaxID=27349 RepID=A0A0L6UEP4_9BASI|nr:hypothetical protein VP01_672g1 [Puccinia sorghi]
MIDRTTDACTSLVLDSSPPELITCSESADFCQNCNQSNGPQYAGKMYSLGWKNGYEASRIGITGIAAKVLICHGAQSLY